MSEGIPDTAIAIVGMAARFPGAPDVEAYWRNLVGGVEGISHFDDRTLEDAGISETVLRDPQYVKAGGVLEKMEWFDAGFFKMSARDATVMDPQTRHFLECTWHALEDAGHVPEHFGGSIGVFAGAGAGQYFWKHVLADPELVDSAGYFLLRHTGNDKDFLSTRASYAFDLQGPSVSIQSACSTSLVAVHYACQSLLAWECDMAVAGGVTIEQPHITGYRYEEGEILSPDGHCRPFDHRSKGTVFGSGVGIVVLRRLSDAIEDGDAIRAVVLGSAVNNDGAGKVSYLAPSVDGQAKVITEALSVAGVPADSIGFVEAHGTGTPVGDPIEVSALTRAFRTHTSDVGYCALGSAKSNLGHLDTAAGVASLIKAALAVERGTIPPTLHFEAPNPLLELEQSPFFVNAEAREWSSSAGPRRAGVSSLGVGGTNAHVIVEQAPNPRPSDPSRPWHLLTLSARSSTALADASRELVEHLERRPEQDFADVSYTLRNGRRRFAHRRAIVCGSSEEAIETLSTGKGPRSVDAVTDHDSRAVAFLFAGGGAQYPGMGRELYENEPAFREAADRCFRQVRSEADFDLEALLYGSPDDAEAAAAELRRPSRSLPALFTVQYAQAVLWKAWGVEPSTLVGHSMGEYTAACLAGVMSVESALSLVLLRGNLFETLPEGAMLSVAMSESDLASRLPPSLSIAAVNAPDACVAAGPTGEITAFEKALEHQGIDCRRIHIDVAAHSAMLEPILDTFRSKVSELELRTPLVPLVSNLSGTLAGPEVATPGYWVRHLRETVRFSEGLSGLLGPQGPILLEVGPGRTLTTLARMHPEWTADQPTVTSLPSPDEPSDAHAHQITSFGRLWCSGAAMDWTSFDGEQSRRRVPLPGYPFQREPYFVQRGENGRSPDPADTLEGDVPDDASLWFHRRAWVPGEIADWETPDPPRRALVLCRETGGLELAEALRRSGTEIATVRPGSEFGSTEPSSFEVDPESAVSWESLWRALAERHQLPDLVLHAWSLGESGEAERTLAFTGPLKMIQAADTVAPDHAWSFTAVTSGGIQGADVGALEPMRALIQGISRVVGNEIPGITGRLIEVGAVPESEADRSVWADRAVSEASDVEGDPVVLLRSGERLVERFERTSIDSGPLSAGLREGGTYVVTGGLGGIGLVVARALADAGAARICLVGRRGVPEEPDRDRWLANHPDDAKTARAIREVRALERRGASVLVHPCDVTDRSQVRELIRTVVERFGGVDGVFHAAGILEDGPMLGRDDETVASILGPKVDGARLLDAALTEAGVEPGLVVLFSSVSAVVGAAGQSDYVAANAFLDSFARERSVRSKTRFVSVAWGAWKDVGMAAELAGETRYAEPDPTPRKTVARVSDLFDDREIIPAGSARFHSRLWKDRHWMIREHKARDGDWILPGSGYVELLREALGQVDPTARFGLENLLFLRALRLGSMEERELKLGLDPNGSGWHASVSSRKPGGTTWVEHATAEIREVDVADEGIESVEALEGRIGKPRPASLPEHPAIDFGPRWENIAGLSSIGGEALLELRLPDAFVEDLESSDLHPALLDMATAGAQYLVEDVDLSRDVLVPAGYGRLETRRPLTHEISSHVTLRSWDADSGVASFDITVYDATDEVAACVRDFSMIRIPVDSLGRGADAEKGPSWLEEALAPEEGVAALARILSHRTGPYVAVVKRSPADLAADAKRAPPERRERPKAPSRGPRPDVARALEAHEAVDQAVAIGAPSGVEPARVVAFVVYAPAARATVSELRRFVRRSAGEDSVPQNFVELRTLPHDERGAILLSELRDPFADEDVLVEPRTQTEQTVADIWKDLLGLDRVGIHDNFLDIGGHSLVGIRVLARIQQATSIRLEANALTMQTLEQLAADIDREKTGEDS